MTILADQNLEYLFLEMAILYRALSGRYACIKRLIVHSNSRVVEILDFPPPRNHAAKPAPCLANSFKMLFHL